LAIGASLGIGHTGSSYPDPRLIPAISPGRCRSLAELALDSGDHDQDDEEPVASSTDAAA
jgi:hypothetical protein